MTILEEITKQSLIIYTGTNSIYDIKLKIKYKTENEITKKFYIVYNFK